MPKLLKGLEALQHRGQESWGVAVPGKPVFKKMGLAFNWFNYAHELSKYKGGSGIGHVRYSTKGRSQHRQRPARPDREGVLDRPQRHDRQRRGARQGRRRGLRCKVRD